jgi:predicted GIY-YIG superfamily endonuclease
VSIVYILKSLKNPSKNYTGITENLDKRLKERNSVTQTGYTKKFALWEKETYITFKDRLLAEKFEKYLKSGSGQAFLKKHFIKKGGVRCLFFGQ